MARAGRMPCPCCAAGRTGLRESPKTSSTLSQYRRAPYILALKMNVATENKTLKHLKLVCSLTFDDSPR